MLLKEQINSLKNLGPTKKRMSYISRLGREGVCLVSNYPVGPLFYYGLLRNLGKVSDIRNVSDGLKIIRKIRFRT